MNFNEIIIFFLLLLLLLFVLFIIIIIIIYLIVFTGCSYSLQKVIYIYSIYGYKNNCKNKHSTIHWYIVYYPRCTAILVTHLTEKSLTKQVNYKQIIRTAYVQYYPQTKPNQNILQKFPPCVISRLTTCIFPSSTSKYFIKISFKSTWYYPHSSPVTSCGYITRSSDRKHSFSTWTKTNNDSTKTWAMCKQS